MEIDIDVDPEDVPRLKKALKKFERASNDAGRLEERAQWVERLRVWRRWFVLADDMIDSSVLLEELDKDFPEIKDSPDAE